MPSYLKPLFALCCALVLAVLFVRVFGVTDPKKQVNGENIILRLSKEQGIVPLNYVRWLNNDLVVFTGADPVNKKSFSRTSKFVLDVRSARLETIPQGDKRRDLCLDGDKIHYVWDEWNESERFTIDIHDLQHVEKEHYFVPDGNKAGQNYVFNKTTCLWENLPAYLGQRFEKFFDVGYVVYSSAGGINRAKLIDNKGNIVNENLFPVMQVGSVQYRPLLSKNGGLFYEFPSTTEDYVAWERNKMLSVYELDKNGQVSPFLIPYGPWSVGGDAWMFPLQSSYLIGTKAWNLKLRSIGNAGIYTVAKTSDHKYRRILSGIVDDMDVSPDGCLVASISSSFMGADFKMSNQLIVQNLCAKNAGVAGAHGQ